MNLPAAYGASSTGTSSPTTGVKPATFADLNYIEYVVNTTTSGVQCPFDFVAESSGGGFDVSTEGELGVLTAGRYRIDYNCGLGSVDQDIELKIDGVVKRTHKDGSVSNREKPIILDITAGAVITITTGTAALWYGTTGNQTTDKDYCRIVVQQLATAQTIGSSDTEVNDQTVSGYFDIGNMRQQWGAFDSTSDDNESFLYPHPFGAGMIPNVSVTLIGTYSATARGAGMVNNPSMLGFSVNRIDGVQNADNPQLMWQSIGFKP